MSHPNVHNVNVASQEILVAPAALRDTVQVSDDIHDRVAATRQSVADILDRVDHRLMVVVGPCSIHDTAAAMEYARNLKAVADRVSDTLLIIMRVYFEKPRTTVGWKGLINDPHLDDSFDIKAGLTIGRSLLRDILELGLPTATEALDPITPQYLQDLISWSAIGARTTESQTHREMASGLSSAVGFKNGTDGGLDVAVNAMKSVCNPHRFLGINSEGKVAISKPGATVTDTSYCVVDPADPTMTVCTLRCASRRWRKPPCPRTSWWTVATPTPTSSPSYSPWSRRMWPTRL